MIKMTKKMMVPLDTVVVDFENNVRERDITAYNDPILRQDLAGRGQITAAKMRKIGDKHIPLQGNRRAYNMLILAKEGIEDPRTCRRDDNGSPIPGTGKPFSTIEAEVYENLTDREAVLLKLDHGNVRGLSSAELQYAIEEAFNVGYNEREVVYMLGGLFMQHYPPKREIKPVEEDKGADLLANYRGVLQAAKNRWRAPTKLHDLAMQVLRKKQSWPTKVEISDGLNIFLKAVDQDKTGTIDRNNPGAAFDAWFDKLVEIKTPKPGEEDARRQKTTSMFNRQQVAEAIKVCDSRIGKWFLYYILRDERVRGDAFVTVNKLAAKAFALLTPEDQKSFDECWNPDAPAETTEDTSTTSEQSQSE